MPKTTRPRVRAGEWVEAWVCAYDPRRGRIKGQVRNVHTDAADRECFRLEIQGMLPCIKYGSYGSRLANKFYQSEIIRRLRIEEIIALKLGCGYSLSQTSWTAARKWMLSNV